MKHFPLEGLSLYGVAAKVMTFGRLGEKGTPWHFWGDKSRLAGVPKKVPPSKNIKICSDPISADPLCSFPTAARGTRP